MTRLHKILVVMILCLSGCASKPSSSTPKKVETPTPSIETEEENLGDVNSIKEFTKDDIDTFFHDGAMHKIRDATLDDVSLDDLSKYDASNSVYDENGIQIYEVLMKPYKLMADYVLNEPKVTYRHLELTIQFACDKELSEDALHALDSVGLYAFDAIKNNAFTDIEIEDKNIVGKATTVYFIPICYKVEENQETTYVPKVNESLNGVNYIDGIYDFQFFDPSA